MLRMSNDVTLQIAPAVLHTTIGLLVLVLRSRLTATMQVLSNAMSDGIGVPRGDARTERIVGRLAFTTLGAIGLLKGLVELLDAIGPVLP